MIELVVFLALHFIAQFPLMYAWDRLVFALMSLARYLHANQDR